MGIEKQDSPNENTASPREDFKAATDAPFETVAKNEEPPTYPYNFYNRLKSRWPKVCKLMNWEKEGQAINWKYFEVSKNPFSVVQTIQDAILKQGGSLPKHGTDGKFGPETQDALDFVSNNQEQLTDNTQGQSIDLNVDPSNALPEDITVDKESIEWLMRKKMLAILEVMPQVNKTLEAKNLDIDINLLKSPTFDEIDVTEFQTRAMQFREELLAETPQLALLNSLVNELIPVFESELKKVDLANISSAEDLMRTIMDLGKKLEPNLKSIAPEEAKMLIEKIDAKTLMSFFMASFNELVTLTAGHFKNDAANFERIIQSIESKFIVSALPSSEEQTDSTPNEAFEPSPLKQESKSNWQDIVNKGPVSFGTVEFVKNEQPVTLNLDEMTLTVDKKVAKIVLPAGATLKSVQAFDDGSVVLQASLFGFSKEKVLSNDALNSTLAQINGASSGDTIDIGEGAYLEIV